MTDLAAPETIVALATAPYRAGVGVVRVSGSKVKQIAESIIGKCPSPKKAQYASFYKNDQCIDQGIAIYFKGPNSFTGEDVLELQGHGGPVVLDQIIETVLSHGAVMAKPGEFSMRAFLNGKVDLAQAEAISDLIHASTIAASKSAMRSLNGEFSNQIKALNKQVISARVYVEAAIDFPEEEIDFLQDEELLGLVDGIEKRFTEIHKKTQEGVLLNEGASMVLLGAPNSGKSSLLNGLAGQDRAIVTDVPGTTRDLIHEKIHIDGIPIEVIDTAGLRDTSDCIEMEGIKRAIDAANKANIILWVQDITKEHHEFHESLKEFENTAVIRVLNKVDLRKDFDAPFDSCCISAKTLEGFDSLKDVIKNKLGYSPSQGTFTARRRHLDALKKASESLNRAKQQLIVQRAGELAAEELKDMQVSLSEITGEFTSDDLLGEIFSNFCIGK